MTDIAIYPVETFASTTVPGPLSRSTVTVVQPHDTQRYGAHRIRNYVKYNSVYAMRRVSLFRRESNGFLLIAQTWSDPITGVYDFPNIAPGVYFVFAEDYLKQKNMVAADPVQSEPMS